MTDAQYRQLKTKYTKWKHFLFTEFENYETAKRELQAAQHPTKQILVDSYEAIAKVVLELEGFGLGLTASSIHE